MLAVLRGSADRWTDLSQHVPVLSPRPKDGGTRRSASDEAGGSVSVWWMPPCGEDAPLRRWGAASPRLAAVGQEAGIFP